MKRNLLKRTSGGTLVEYAIILVLVSIIGVLLLKGIGGTTNSKLNGVPAGFQ
jgi:Flp pilus assembly pilin Flp